MFYHNTNFKGGSVFRGRVTSMFWYLSDFGGDLAVERFFKKLFQLNQLLASLVAGSNPAVPTIYLFNINRLTFKTITVGFNSITQIFFCIILFIFNYCIQFFLIKRP